MTQAVSAMTETQIMFDANSDSNPTNVAMSNTTTDDITIKSTGPFMITFTATLSTMVNNNNIDIYVKVNGTTITSSHRIVNNGTNTNLKLNLSNTIWQSLNANDTVALYAIGTGAFTVEKAVLLVRN